METPFTHSLMKLSEPWAVRELPGVMQRHESKASVAKHPPCVFLTTLCLDSRIHSVYLLASKWVNCLVPTWPVCKSVPSIHQGHGSAAQQPAHKATNTGARLGTWQLVVSRGPEVRKPSAWCAGNESVEAVRMWLPKPACKSQTRLMGTTTKILRDQVNCLWWDTVFLWLKSLAISQEHL